MHLLADEDNMKHDGDDYAPNLDRIQDLLSQAFSAIDDRPDDAKRLIRGLFANYDKVPAEDREMLDRTIMTLAGVSGPKLS
jgi:hypothetical protein